MPYCTQPDITGRISEHVLIQLTDDDHLGVVDTAMVTRAIADADELIDGFLRGKYTLPLDPVPGMIKSLSLDLSVYNLYGRRPDFDTPKAVAERQVTALRILKEIRTGAITLGSAGTETPAAVSGAGTVAAPERVFSKDVLDGY